MCFKKMDRGAAIVKVELLSRIDRIDLREALV
jgi:hypothetical protein